MKSMIPTLIIIGLVLLVLIFVVGMRKSTEAASLCGPARTAMLWVISLLPHDPKHTRLGTGDTYVDDPLLGAMNAYKKKEFERILKEGEMLPDSGDSYSRLSIATKHCDTWFMSTLLKYGANPNGGPEVPLRQAILLNSIPKAKILLDAGADPNMNDRGEVNMPLFDALLIDDYAMADYLLDRGANPVLSPDVIQEVIVTVGASNLRSDSERGIQRAQFIERLRLEYPEAFGALEA